MPPLPPHFTLLTCCTVPPHASRRASRPYGRNSTTPAWGSMLSESRDFLYVAWWLAAFPGMALALTALGINLVGDWLRDVLDPRFRV